MREKERVNAGDGAEKERREGDDRMWERKTQDMPPSYSVWEVKFTKYVELTDMTHSTDGRRHCCMPATSCFGSL